MRRIQFNTRERVLSNDWSRGASLQARALTAGIASVAGDDQPRSGVVSGYRTSVVDSTLTVSVSAGLALLHRTPPSADDHAMAWVESVASQVVDLAASVDAGNPRWICIELDADPPATSEAQLRDIFVPSLGTFSSESVPKVVDTSPARLHIVAGTPSATPALPAPGSSTRLPLAYVYLEASATSIDAGDVILCRPVHARAELDAVHGGGVSVTTSGTVCTVHRCAATVNGQRIQTQHATGVDLDSPAMWVDSEDYPTGRTPIYLYGIAAPYPSGYHASMMPREFVPGATVASRIPSVSDAGLIVASTVPPDPDDPLGGDVLSGLAHNDPAWSGGVVTRSVYLGSVTRGTTSALLRQNYAGRGRVRFRAESGQLPEEDTGAVLNDTASGTGRLRMADPLSATGDQVLPDTSFEFDVLTSIQVSNGAPATGGNFDIDLFSAGGQAVYSRADRDDSHGPPQESGTHQFWGGSDGSFGWIVNSSTGDYNLSVQLGVRTTGYTDVVLGQR